MDSCSESNLYNSQKMREAVCYFDITASFSMFCKPSKSGLERSESAAGQSNVIANEPESCEHHLPRFVHDHALCEYFVLPSGALLENLRGRFWVHPDLNVALFLPTTPC